MTIHKSLVLRSKLVRHRNVLKRDERIIRLQAEEKWKEEDSVFGLSKIRNILHRAKKVKKEAKEDEAVAAAVPGGAAVPAGTAPAAGAKAGAAVGTAKTAAPAGTAVTGGAAKPATAGADKAAQPKAKK
ncbi:MAG: small basic protein [Planctomycetes bacterium]|nr:small basic protein [Planctomycetota bacterium]